MTETFAVPSENKVKGFAKNTLVFSCLTIASRLTGVLRTMTFAAVLGGGVFNDAYTLPEMIPYMLFEVIIGGLLTAVFLPILVKEQEKHGKSSAEAWRTANLLLGGIGCLLAIMSVVVIICSPLLIQLLTLQSKEVTYKALSATYLRWFAPEILFFGISSIFMSILNSHGKFAVTAAAPIFNNLVMIATLIAYHYGLIAPQYLALGATLGVLTQVLVMVPSLRRCGMPIRPIINYRDPLFHYIWSIAPPIICLSLANLLASIVRTNLLSPIEGGVTSYKYCFQFVMMPYGVIAFSIITVLAPTLSRYSANGMKKQYALTLSLGLRTIFCIMLPIMVYCILLSHPITQVLFERGRFTPDRTAFTANFLQAYALTILTFSLANFLTNSFFVASNTKIPTRLNISGAGLNIVLGIILLHYMGAPGVALSSGITYLITSAIGLFFMKRHYPELDLSGISKTFLKAILAVIIMASSIVTLLQIFPQQATSVIIASGEVYDLKLPAFNNAGDFVPVKDDAALNKIWPLLTSETTVPKTINIEPDSQYIIVFAPETNTTTSLQIVPPQSLSELYDYLTNTKNGNIKISVKMVAKDKALQAKTRHAWALIRTQSDTDTLTPIFVKTGTSVISIVALFRLFITLIVGTFTYVLSGLAFGLSEFEFFTKRFKRN